MNIKAFCIAGASGVLLAACAGFDTKRIAERPDRLSGAANPRCEAHEKECHIEIHVRDCKIERVSPDKKIVKYRKGGVSMVWTIVGSDAVFAPPGKGIRFKKGGPFQPERVFRLEKFEPNSATFRMRNATEPEGEFPYAINVIQKGKPCDEHDPSVVNEW